MPLPRQRKQPKSITWIGNKDIEEPSESHQHTPRLRIALPSHPISSHEHKMTDSSRDKQSALFQVYLRLRPPPAPSSSAGYPALPAGERFLTVEPAPHESDDVKTHITLNPPNDNRRRAVEKFAFTRVFEEGASQLDVFGGTGVLELVEGVLGHSGGEGRDGLLATLGVTGSGKVCFLSLHLHSLETEMNLVSCLSHGDEHC